MSFSSLRHQVHAGQQGLPCRSSCVLLLPGMGRQLSQAQKLRQAAQARIRLRTPGAAAARAKFRVFVQGPDESDLKGVDCTPSMSVAGFKAVVKRKAKMACWCNHDLMLINKLGEFLLLCSEYTIADYGINKESLVCIKTKAGTMPVNIRTRRGSVSLLQVGRNDIIDVSLFDSLDDIVRGKGAYVQQPDMRDPSSASTSVAADVETKNTKVDVETKNMKVESQPPSDRQGSSD